MSASSSNSAGAESDEYVPEVPVGRTIDEHVIDGHADSEERAELERLAVFEEIARMVIMRRAQLELSQADLARRMNRPRSVVSRLESGQHPTSPATLKRVAEALDGRAIMGFAFGPPPAVPNTVQL